MADPTITNAEALARAMYEALPYQMPVEGDQWPWDQMVAEGWHLPNSYRRWADVAIATLRQSHDRELEALRERCRAGDYLIDRLVAIGAGKCVRDLEEAWGAYRAALARKEADHA